MAPRHQLRGTLAQLMSHFNEAASAGLGILNEMDVLRIRHDFRAEAADAEPMNLGKVMTQVLELWAQTQHEDPCCSWAQAWHAWALLLLDRLQVDLRHSASSALDIALRYCLSHPALALSAASETCRAADPAVVGLFVTVTSLASLRALPLSVAGVVIEPAFEDGGEWVQCSLPSQRRYNP